MNFKGGKRDIYEGGHRVPFLMRWPHMIRAGSMVDVPVCQSDYLATIADIVGAELPDNAAEDSYSLLPLMSENSQEEYQSERAVIHHSASGHFAIRKGKWKLNMLRGSGGSLEPRFIEPKEGEAPYELYNMETDTDETTNLYFEQPEIVETLKAEISEIIKSGRSTPGTPQDFVKDNWEQVTWMEF
jgi:arylsulfatase A